MTDAKAEIRQSTLDEAKVSLERMQQFDPKSLPRVGDLGAVLNFEDAIEPATRLIELYRQVAIEVLESLPIAKLNSIKSNADANFNQLDSVLKFEPGTPKPERDSLIQQLFDAYDPAFEQMSPIISYSVRRSTDFEKLGREARAVIQSVKDDAENIRSELDASKQAANTTLDAIKKAAAEQGVSQEAIHFKKAGEGHSTAVKKWLNATVAMSAVLALFSVSTLFLHKLGPLKPTDTFESIQLTIGKTLIFGTVFFILMYCARNYLAHRHNAIVNRHRQNALATYITLVKAANEQTNSDIVLNRAAECIFTPQPSGYAKGGPEVGSVSLLSVGPNSVKTPGT